jgi:hypothetical protein
MRREIEPISRQPGGPFAAAEEDEPVPVRINPESTVALHLRLALIEKQRRTE